MTIRKWKGRYFALFDADGSLIVVTLYKKGALEVKRRLERACHGSSPSGPPIPARDLEPDPPMTAHRADP